MKPIGHIIISTAVAFSFGLIFKSYSIGLISWLAGWIIDFDHLIDYAIYLKKFKKKFNLEEFVSGDYFKKLGKIYVLGHSWEYLILFFFLGNYFPWQLLTTVSVSYFFHMILDQLSYDISHFLYFLSYRIKVNFNTEKLFKL